MTAPAPLPFAVSDMVRVVRLDEPARYVSGTASVLRQPAVGDEGSVVNVERGVVMVESVDAEGRTVWLADFFAGELELVSRRAG